MSIRLVGTARGAETPASGKVDERAARVLKRVSEPYDNIMKYLTSYDFRKDIEDHNQYVKDMCDDPYPKYVDLRERLKKHGGVASFEKEFKGVIAFLSQFIFQSLPKTEDGKKFLSLPTIMVRQEQLVHSILSVQIQSRYKYPYRSTVMLIKDMLAFIDQYCRVTQNITNPYYHSFRYMYYMTMFLDDPLYGQPHNIVFPTCAKIGATQLIKMRCVPILIMGVTTETLYVDQYHNTPLDFWAHDIQHSKRQIQETQRYFDQFIAHREYYRRRTVFDTVLPEQFYEEMNTYAKNTIVPLINVTKNLRENDLTAYAYRCIKRIIIFEVVHEKAWPLTQKSLIRNIRLRYDSFPVENIDADPAKGVVYTFDYLFDDPTTLGNVRAKLRGGFYDRTTELNDTIVPSEYRTSMHVATAAHQLLNELGDTDNVPFEYLLALTTDNTGCEELLDRGTIQPQYPENPVEPEPYTENDSQYAFDDALLSTYYVKIASHEPLHHLRYVPGASANTE